MKQVTAEQEMLVRMIKEFAETEIAQEVPRMEREDRFPRELIQKMGSLGLMGIPIPVEYGGAGMNYTSYIQAVHQISKVSAAVGVILSVHTSVGTNPIVYFGTEQQKQHYLPKLASGQYIGAFALSEPNAGSDAGGIRTKAVKSGNSYLLNGSKVFITNGGEADTYITFARTGEGKRDISAFIVEKDTPGFIIGKKERKMGLHGSNTVSLTFDNCQLSGDQLLGKEHEGFAIAMHNLNIGRIGIAAQALGISDAAVTHAINYAKERKQFTGPIADNQGISFKLADMATRSEAAKLLVYQAASLVEQGVSCAKEVSMAKLYASKSAVKNAIEAVQVLGGYGYTEDYPVERLFRDAKITEIYEGTSEIQHMVIAKHLLKK
ncbi:acyl-CoA dehydrogenase [Virgibacillus salexigens]|uniref:Acyl-CoA dehydrogenase n=2 Tax=Virgibacillus TaxID=84406 RepID=A0A024Q7J6_9BACI|nr:MULTISPECIES: acyl-CoA dehydrogenase [Virgibacillus]MYL40929.1 acyl-CoA dehydrogenase [Virgibacillus massiliensis]GGJ52893.1 acyl-CoA dehydrogenase [Virgibacillus kapii]CDQ38272.1 Acyl-CoA dehydrogenase [Virgibacillus massiliensis]